MATRTAEIKKETRKFRSYMTKILDHHRSRSPRMRALVKEARRIRDELASRDWDIKDYRDIAKFVGEKDAYFYRVTLPLQEWVYVGGHLHTASDVDEMFPRGWRKQAEKERARRARGKTDHGGISIQPRHPD